MAEGHGIHVSNRYRDDIVRSIWIYDRGGNERVQIWLEAPDNSGAVTIHAALLALPPLREWTKAEVRVAARGELASKLDDLQRLAFEWAGPNAFG